MPRCHCEERIKVLEENLLLLHNLLVKGNVLVEGNLIVKGKITDENGGLPDFGQGATSDPCTATLTPRTFNINSVQPTCRNITQDEFILGASSVLFGQLTNGLFTFTNRSPFHTINIVNIGVTEPVYRVAPRAQVKITFTNGVITAIQEPIPV